MTEESLRVGAWNKGCRVTLYGEHDHRAETDDGQKEHRSQLLSNGE